MQSCGRAVTGRIVLARITLSSLLFGMFVAGVDAQDAHSDARDAGAILAQFEEAWNDESWGPSEGRIGKYMRPMDDVGWKSRMAAFQRIVQHGTPGVPDLVKALESESTPVRALAAQVLGYCGTADAKPALARVMQRDADAMVRLYAADSLGMLGGHDHEDLLRRLEPNEKNRDTKRHIGYALDREGQSLDAEVVAGVRQWNIESLGAASLGQPAPDFELASLDGQRIRLSQFRGKQAVVLVFVYGDT